LLIVKVIVDVWPASVSGTMYTLLPLHLDREDAYLALLGEYLAAEAAPQFLEALQDATQKAPERVAPGDGD
jgi:hypothetical protein